MLFNSAVFIFLFLPTVVAGFYVLGSLNQVRLAKFWLALASLFFYGWWNSNYVILLAGSIFGNYLFGLVLIRTRGNLAGRTVLTIGIAANLALLGYFKYANFFIDTVNVLGGTDWVLGKIILPLAISFFTFQQITYLVDAWRSEAREYDFLDYGLFVTFFPQLIAGPIVHHREMMPQFSEEGIGRFNAENLSVGITIFVIGLFKKTVIADTAALYSTPVFDTALTGTSVGLLTAWQAALAYTVQIYFDFSGYSDMAIGIARMFGIRLPLNFNSPYKASGIIDFWRRWHMTLSRFLRDYLYVPLGGNRKGPQRRYVNLMIVMLLGGLWHGAGWTFVAWGALHGVFLVINNLWRDLIGRQSAFQTLSSPILSHLITLIAVVVAWVFFRAESFAAATTLLHGMAGMNGLDALAGGESSSLFSPFGLVFCIIMMGFCFLAPNTQELLSDYRPAIDSTPAPLGGFAKSLAWKPAPRFAVAVSALAVASLLFLWNVSEFLYFQF